MYDELIKNLRGMAKGFCPFDIGNKMCGYFVTQEAADAIEELQKQLQKSEEDNVNLTGWLAEEHARAEEAKGKNMKYMLAVANQYRWIPVTERLPEDRQRVLVFYWLDLKPKQPWHQVCYFASNLNKVDKYDFDGCNHSGFYNCDSEYGYYELDDVTHWMPLPQPPEDGET